MSIIKVVTLSKEDVAKYVLLKQSAKDAEQEFNRFHSNLVVRNKPKRPTYGPYDAYDRIEETFTYDGHLVFHD